MAEGEDKISSLFDIPAIQKESDQIFDTLLKQVKDFPKIKIELEGASNLKDFSTATQKMSKETDLIAKSVTRLEFAISEENVELQKNNALTAAATKEAKALGKEQAGLSTEYDKQAKRLAEVKNQLKGLIAAGQEGTKEFKKLKTEFDTLDKSVRKADQAVGDFQRNVGNYAGSLAKPFETMQKRLAEIKSQLKSGINLDPATVSALTQQEAAIENGLKKISKEGATAAQQMRAVEGTFQTLSLTTTSIINPSTRTSANTFLDEFKKDAAEAKDSVQDLKDELKLQASDTRGIDNVVGSLNALAGIAQGAASAYVLLGGSQEDAAKVTAKLLALQGIANSVQQVGTELTRRGSIANKAYAAVENLVATAKDRSAAASVRLAAASKLLLGGLIIGAIAYFIVKIVEANKALNAFEAQQKLTSNVMAQAGDSFASASAEVSSLKENIRLAKEGLISKESVVKQYNESIGKTTGEVKNLEEAEKALNKNADAYVKYTLYKAAANIAFQEAGKKAFEAQQKLLNPEAIPLVDQAKNKVTQSPFRALISLATLTPTAPTDAEIQKNIKDSKTQNDKQVKGLTDEQLALEKIGADFQRKQADIAKLFNFKTTPEDKKPDKIKDNTAEQLLKIQFEKNKLRIEDSRDANQKILDDETKTYTERIDALRNFNTDQINLIELEKQFEISQEKLKLQGILESIKEQKKQKGANIKALNDQEKKEREVSAAAIELIELQSASKLNKVAETFITDQRRLAKQRQDIRDEELKDIEAVYAQQEDVIKKYYAKIKSLDEQAAADKKTRDEKLKADQKSANARLYDEIQTTFFFFLQASLTREEGYLNEKKRLLDESTERQINQINLLGLTEIERTQKIAEIQKNAAFQNEQIEARKRQIAVQRARFEKAQSIVSIIQSTAQAVVGALGMKPWTPLNIALAATVGALGVLQLARAIAQPIPKFKEGKKNRYEGLAIVGEGGQHEFIKRKSGVIERTPNVATLTHLMSDDIVYKDERAFRNALINASNPYNQINRHAKKEETDVSMYLLKDVIGQLKQLNRKPPISLHNQLGIETTAWYKQHFKN